ncbi:RNA polymerase factor sigma-54 [Ancylobacter dichloromethanicus]|uniref:RNA polymerase sigma-54 factor n=1 Tax=Ancylobacter dichloromethanicus TaxID=518825 RepID=A0A9W6JA67_9HYPH|nr:RNA polymerase factor sigma-54 [Ancylobacter dichloromethanicus]MBS7556681.1 RNA polymerase factor sigma-54 [Ancylobacter dichloromethanicus]GLK73532.1 RNA polymerase sigma-54 factor 2 [Ancylobacter dichloromethanicus]
MSLGPRLEFRQTQSLVMTPQLMQAIKLLQLSNLDLVAYVEAELERNPLLERQAEPEGERAGEGEADGNAVRERTSDADLDPRAESGGERDPGDERASDWLEERLDTSRSAIEDRLDTGMENVFPDDAGREPVGPAPSGEAPAYSEWTGVGGGGHDAEGYNLEAFVSAETSLADHLESQLTLAVSDPVERIIGHNLIDMIDEAGYLSADLAGVAERLGAPLTTVEKVLGVVQTFDPAGIGARSLAECLAIQLRERNRYDPCMAALLAHLELLARREFTTLKRVCGVDDEDLAEMVGEIRRLNPKPGLAFGSGIIQPVVPDVFVRGATDNWLVELNSETLPRVLVNQAYYSRVQKITRDEREKAFLSDCMQTATWLTRSLDQRARTILKVATEIVRQQDAFLSLGVQHLRPLNLRMVADAIGMHESTVSRVTSNKYMSTPRGIFEMKYFFSSSISSSDGGEAHSAESVRFRIKQMIEAESPDDVLSDDTLVQRLREAGIDIARRTVAKYREAMRIPSSVQRRREKQAAVSAG